ncbi:MAG: hypothetical protein U0573_01425 [Phycisphaerales bacterium]|nr:hypothetical protein [Planctomycetota bacterium]
MVRFSALLGVTAISLSASAQVIWTPKVSRTNAVATLISFNASSVAAQSSKGTMTVPADHFISGLEFTPDGRLWATVQGPAGSMQQGLYSVNQATGGVTQVGAPVGLNANEVITDLAWNPVNHRLTGMATTTSGSTTSRLINFDVHSGAVASVVPVNSLVNVLHVGLTCRPSGEFIFLDVYNGFVSHLVDGDAIWLGTNLTFHPAYNQGFGTDFSTGKIWYTAYQIVNPLQGTGAPSLRTINPETGGDTFVANMPGGSNTIYTDAAVQPVVLSCPADFNSDSFVQDNDFVVFAGQYDAFECGTPQMPSNCSADLNFDGVVDDTDFVIFAAAYDSLVCS